MTVLRCPFWLHSGQIAKVIEVRPIRPDPEVLVLGVQFNLILTPEAQEVVLVGGGQVNFPPPQIQQERIPAHFSDCDIIIVQHEGQMG